MDIILKGNTFVYMADITGNRKNHQLIEKIFNRMSSSVSIALIKKSRLCYEFYGGKYFTAENNGRDIGRSTRFNLGTASMPITGSLIVKLMEFGEVSLSDRVKKFIPEFKFPDIKVYHLLTHTSGLTSGSLPEPSDPGAKSEFLRQVYDVGALSYETGSESRLFPYGYAILADIIERVSGQTVEEFAQALIFLPLGMDDTTFGSISLRNDQFIIPWSHTERRFLTEMKNQVSIGFSGIYTTVLDLLKFGSVFLNGGEWNRQQVFLESSADFMLKEITGGRFMRTPLFMINSKGNRYDLFSAHHSGKAVAHTGDTGSLFYIDPVNNSIGAALTNSTWVNAGAGNYASICDILAAI